MPVTDYKLTIDSKDVNKVLKSVEGRFVKLEKAGNESMKKVGSSGLSMGNVLSGAVGGAFVALAGAALNFGTQAVSAFANVVKSSVSAANTFDVTRRKFISIFEGREGEADAVMDFVSQRASKMGLDMNEALSISRSFIPDVKGTEDPLGTIEDLLVSVRGLTEEDPFQGIAGARIAIDEAMSGSLSSLRRRFEFTKAELDIVKASQVELGEVAGTVAGLNKVLARRGFDIGALKGSFTQNLGEMRFALGKLQVDMGKPIAEEMNESMMGLNQLLAENSDDFQLIAASIGDVVGEVVDFIGSGLVNFLEDIDPSKIQDMVDAFHRVVIQLEILSGLTGEGGFANKFLDAITWLLDKTATLTERFTQLNAILGAFEKGGGLAGILSAEGDTFTDKLTNVIKGSEEIKESFLQTSEALEEGAKKEATYAETAEARAAAQKVSSEAALDEAESRLKAGDAAETQASQLEQLGVSEEKLTDIQEESVKNLKDRLDLEMKFSQERADLHRKSLEDIERNHPQDILESGRELNRDSRDMAQKHTADRAGIEKDRTRKLLDVELQYQRQLEDIQRQTSRDLESAELSQDALAFVDTLRQQEISEEEAGVTKERGEEDAGTEFEQAREDLQVAQELERQTLMQGYADRLEDLQLQLEQEFIEQQIADERAFEQQAITEQRRTDAQAEKEAERLQKLTEGLDAEVAAVVMAEAQKLQSVETAAAQMTAALQSVADQAAAVANAAAQATVRGTRGEREDAGLGSGAGAGTPAAQAAQRRRQEFLERINKANVAQGRSGVSVPTPSGTPLYLPLARRARGGPVGAGQPTIVGELGEELFIPPTSGSIIPNDQLGAFVGAGASGNTSNTEVNFQPTFELSNPAVLSPEQAAATRAIASAVATEMFTRVMGGNN